MHGRVGLAHILKAAGAVLLDEAQHSSLDLRLLHVGPGTAALLFPCFEQIGGGCGGGSGLPAGHTVAGCQFPGQRQQCKPGGRPFHLPVTIGGELRQGQ